MRDRKPVVADTPRRDAQADAPSVPVEQAAKVALSAIDSFITLLAVIMLGAAGVLLTVAWTAGPQVWTQRAEYRKLSERADGTIVESWVALVLDQSRIRSPSHWRASAKAARCAVVEYGASWGAPIRRAFCGPELGFNESYTLADLRDLAPNVPFAWARDERGFAVAQIRLDASARQWLASHTIDMFMHDTWPAKTALDWLRIELDRPVDLAIAGWSGGDATMKVAFEPANAGHALPAGTVDARNARSFNWIAVIVGGVGGLVLWFQAMSILPFLRDVAVTGRWIVAALPLIGLPWFADQLPNALRAMNVSVAEVTADMVGDVDKLGRVVSSDPDDMLRRDDVRLVWRAGDGVYGDTFGRMHFAAPKSPYASADAALAALVASVSAEVAAMDDASRIDLFAKLRRDKQNDLKAAGVVFMPAAKAAIVESSTPAQVREAAKRFLTEWLTQPVEAFDQYSLGYHERTRLYGEIGGVR